MKVTNEEVLTILKGLSELEELKLPLNIKTSYYLARIRQTLNSYANIIQDKQMEIYKKYGEQTSRNEYKVPEEKMNELEKDLKDLFSVENEMEIQKLKLNDFGDNEVPFYVIEKLLKIIDE